MKVGAYLKQSFIDWEGKSTSVIFTKGCNFRCPYCHNPSLVIPRLIKETEDISIASIIEHLQSRKGWLDGVVITGGEPCLQPDIIPFIRKIKAMGYPVKLDTNGYFPEILYELIAAKLIDFVAMDIKTVFNPELYAEISGNKNRDLISNIQKSLSILRESKVDYQLRTTIWERYHTKEIMDSLQNNFAEENYKIQMFRKGDIIEDYI